MINTSDIKQDLIETLEGVKEAVMKSEGRSRAGLISGGLLFSVIRPSIPKGSEGEPLYFIFGVLLYAPIIIASWNL